MVYVILGAIGCFVLLIVAMLVLRRNGRKEKSSPEQPPKKAVFSVEDMLGTSSEMELSALPEGWRSSVDEDSGRSFFFHSSTGETSWNRPSLDSTRGSFDFNNPLQKSA